MTRAALVTAFVLGVLAGVLFASVVSVQGGADGQAFIVLDDDGTWHYALAPSPTNAPHPTNTPSPSASPTPVEATPTPEITTLPTLPPTRTPELKTCQVKVGGFTINARATPSTSAAIVGHVTAGAVVSIQAVTQGDQYLWAYTSAAWFVIRERETWWVYGVEQSELCQDIPGWPVGLEPPPALVLDTPAALLWHAVPGANANEMLASYDILRAKGIPFGVKSVNDTNLCRQAVAAGGICILRSVHPGDCPNVEAPDPRVEARRWMEAIAPYTVNQLAGIDTSWLFVETTNECLFDFSHLIWWREFIDASVDFAVAHNWPPLVLPTLAPGWGDPEMFRVWKPALLKLAAHGGAIGMHDYSITGTLCGGDEWLSYRHRKNRTYMLESEYTVPIAITEAAPGWGNDPVSVEDFACWGNATARDPDVVSRALWTAGPTGAWPNANLNGWLLPIALAATLR